MPAAHPLNGRYTMTFRLYDVGCGRHGALFRYQCGCRSVTGCSIPYSAIATNDVMDGQKFTGHHVGSDPRNDTTTTVIYPVPYAISLIPGRRSAARYGRTMLFWTRELGQTGKGLRSMRCPADTGETTASSARRAHPMAMADTFTTTAVASACGAGPIIHVRRFWLHSR